MLRIQRWFCRAALVAMTGGAVTVMAAPAFASGQFYSAPGFPSSNASCMGTAYDFGTHYGTDGESFPDITHGGVGASQSQHATTDGAGAVGEFSSTMAGQHGSVLTCLP